MFFCIIQYFMLLFFNFNLLMIWLFICYLSHSNGLSVMEQSIIFLHLKGLQLNSILNIYLPSIVSSNILIIVILQYFQISVGKICPHYTRPTPPAGKEWSTGVTVSGSSARIPKYKSATYWLSFGQVALFLCALVSWRLRQIMIVLKQFYCIETRDCGLYDFYIL